MIQTFYGLTALMIAALLSLTMTRAIHSGHTDMILTEFSAQVTSVAADVFDHIGSLPYDPAMISRQLMLDTGLLAEEIEGSPFCKPEQQFASCIVMNDVHGKKFTREVDGLLFEVEVALRYMDLFNPGQVSNVPTLIKEAEVTVRSPQLISHVTNEPLTFVLTRRYSYPRVIG